MDGGGRPGAERRRKLRLRGWAAGLLALVPAPAAAQLAWEEKTVTVQVRSVEPSIGTVYRFRNAGISPVEIKELRSDCGCTVAQLKKRKYAPGEAGQIEVTFAVGQRVGEHTNTVQVLSDDPEAASTSLVFVVTIRELIHVTPRFLYWRLGEMGSKVATVELDSEEKLELQDVKSSNPFFRTQFLPKGARGSYRLIVTPANPDAREASTLTITAVTPEGAKRTFQLSARIL